MLDIPKDRSTDIVVQTDSPVDSQIDYEHDGDYIRVQLTVGHNYIFNLLGQTSDNRLTLIDPVLELVDDGLNIVAWDDDGGRSLEARVAYTPVASGTYYLVASAYSGVGTYRLAMEDLARADDHGQTLATASSLDLGVWAAGAINSGGDHDWFGVYLEAGVRYALSLTGQDGSKGSLEDPVLTIHDEHGTAIRSNDDYGDSVDSFIEFTPTDSGTYYLDAASAYEDAIGSYHILAKVTGNVGITLLGTVGDDRLIGGPGDDRLDGGDGHDRLAGDAGRDYLDGGAGGDILYGGDDGDILYGGGDDDYANGEAGDDYLSGGSGADELHGGAGVDLLAGDAGRDRLYGEAGDDRLEGGADGDILIGGSGGDILIGADGDDYGNGGDQDDYANGGAGDDVLLGDSGDDQLHGDAGADNLQGGLGRDWLDGGDGGDTLYGGGGGDTLLGQAGDDYLVGGEDDDYLHGGIGNDVLLGRSGRDVLLGWDGDDSLQGGDGDDNLQGGGGADWLYGEAGADILYGGNGDDVLVGGDGDDYLIGGPGADYLVGGTGNDTFVVGAGEGSAIIADFASGAASGDRIQLSGSWTSFSDVMAHSVQSGASVIVDLGNGTSLTLQNVAYTALDAGDFYFL